MTKIKVYLASVPITKEFEVESYLDLLNQLFKYSLQIDTSEKQFHVYFNRKLTTSNNFVEGGVYSVVETINNVSFKGETICISDLPPIKLSEKN